MVVTLNLDCHEKHVLIVGACSQANDLLTDLVKSGSTVTLISTKSSLCSDLAEKVGSGEFAWFNRSAHSKDVDGKDLVFDFSSIANEALARACAERQVFLFNQKSPFELTSNRLYSLNDNVFFHAAVKGDAGHFLNHAVNEMVANSLPSYVETAAENFDAIFNALEGSDSDSRHKFLNHISKTWPLEAIAHITPSNLSQLLKKFRKGELSPSAIEIVGEIQKQANHLKRAISSQSTANGYQEDVFHGKPPSPPCSVKSLTDVESASEQDTTIHTSVDGLHAVSNIAYQFSDLSFNFSSGSSDTFEKMNGWVGEKKANVSGHVPKIVEIQSSFGGAKSVLGAMMNGSRVSALLSSASLGHLIPSMFGFSRQNLSPVFHVAASTHNQDLVTLQSNSSVFKAANTGFAILSSGSSAEAQDIALFSHLLAQSSSTPVLHFYDGILVQSQKNPLALYEHDHLSLSLDATKDAHGDIFHSFDALGKNLTVLFGKKYSAFEYTGPSNPRVVFISMGFISNSILEAFHMETFENIGLLNIRLYRPWNASLLLSHLPKSVEKIVVVDFQSDSPLLLDIQATLSKVDYFDPTIVAAHFAPGLENIHPQTIVQFLQTHATLNSKDCIIKFNPVSHKAYEGENAGNLIEAIFWDEKKQETSQVRSIIQKVTHTHEFQQAFVQHLSIAANPAEVTYYRSSGSSIVKRHLINQADIVMVNSLSTASQFNFAQTIKNGGKVFINSSLSATEILNLLPAVVRKDLSKRKIQIFCLDADLIARNYTIFYGNTKDYLMEVLASVFYSLAYSNENAEAFLSSQRLGIIEKHASSPNIVQSLTSAIEFTLEKLSGSGFYDDYNLNTDDDAFLPVYPQGTFESDYIPRESEPPAELELRSIKKYEAILPVIFPSAFKLAKKFRPDLDSVYSVKVSENIRLTPSSYERNVFHMELDITDTGIKYEIGNALGVYAENDSDAVGQFLKANNYDGSQLVCLDRCDSNGSQISEMRSIEQIFTKSLDIFGKPGKKFYQFLASNAQLDFDKEKIAKLLQSSETFDAFVEKYTPTFADLLAHFPSVQVSVEKLIHAVPVIKPRLYSISSSQRAHPNSIHLLIVLVDWVSPGDGRKRFGQATNYLVNSKIGSNITVCLKPSVMKLPPSLESPVIMSGLGTGMAPFRAFIQERMYWKSKGKKVGPMSLYFGSRNRANEYLYGEELEAYHAEGILTHLRLAFSRDQKEKVYIQNKIEQDTDVLFDLLVQKKGSFYLCGPTWPVPDVTAALLKAIEKTKSSSEAREYLEQLKEHERFVLEVY